MKTRIWIIAIASAVLLAGFGSVSYSQEKSKTPSKSITKIEKTVNTKAVVHTVMKDSTKTKMNKPMKKKSETKMHHKMLKPTTTKKDTTTTKKGK